MKILMTALLILFAAPFARADVQREIPKLNLICQSNVPQMPMLRLRRGDVDASAPDRVAVGFHGDPMGVSQAKGSHLQPVAEGLAFDLTWTNAFGTTMKVLVILTEGQTGYVRSLAPQAGVEFTCTRGPDIEPLPAVTIGN